MQVCIDITCMYTNFGGCGLSDFGDTAMVISMVMPPFVFLQKSQNFPSDLGLYSPWGSKNRTGSKIYDVYMFTKLGG